jgi:hypothetical protein
MLLKAVHITLGFVHKPIRSIGKAPEISLFQTIFFIVASVDALSCHVIPFSMVPITCVYIDKDKNKQTNNSLCFAYTIKLNPK